MFLTQQWISKSAPRGMSLRRTERRSCARTAGHALAPRGSGAVTDKLTWSHAKAIAVLRGPSVRRADVGRRMAKG